MNTWHTNNDNLWQRLGSNTAAYSTLQSLKEHKLALVGIRIVRIVVVVDQI